MNCAEVNGLLDRLMDGELTDGQRRELEAHGRECPACAEAIRSTMRLKALFDDMGPEVDVPLEAQAKWRGAVKAEAAGQKRRRMIRWIASAAAAVVAVAGIGLSLNGRNAPDKGATLTTVGESAVGKAVEDGDSDYVVAQAAPAAVANSAEVSLKLAQDVQEDAEYAAGSAGEAAYFDSADSAVVEADGSAESAAVDGEANGLTAFEEDDAPLVCAASAQRAPACEITVHVQDVDTACRRVRDLAEEYEASADVQALEDGGANVYIEIAAENADDFLNAVLPMDVSDDPIEPPELSDEGTLLILLTVVQ